MRDRLRSTSNPEDPDQFNKALAEQEQYQSQQNTDLKNCEESFIRHSRDENTLSKLSRYKTSMERSLDRAIYELQRLQPAQQGKEVPVPVVVDIDVSGVEPQAINDPRCINDRYVA